MKHKAFVEIVAQATGVPEKTVTVYVRALKEAGLVTSGARGVNAPEMTRIDAVRVLIALLATDKPADAERMVRLFKDAPYRPEMSAEYFAGDQYRLPADAPFEEVLEGTLKSAGDMKIPFSWPIYVEIQRHSKIAVIEIGELESKFRRKDNSEFEQNGREFKGIRRTCGLNSLDMIELAIPFSIEDHGQAEWEQLINDGRAQDIFAGYAFGLKDERGHDG